MVKGFWKRKLLLQTKTALEQLHCPLLFFLISDPNWPSLKQLVKDQIFRAMQTLPPTSIQVEKAFTALFCHWSICNQDAILSLWLYNWHLVLPSSLFVKIQQDDSLWNSFVHHYVIVCFPVIFRVCFRSWVRSSCANWSFEDFSYF